MILGHVLVVLREELRVLEGYDRTVGSLQHRRGITAVSYTHLTSIHWISITAT